MSGEGKKKERTETAPPMSFRLTKELRDALKKSAEEHYRPVSQHVAWIIANYLTIEERSKAPRETQDNDQSLGSEKTQPDC